MDLELDGKKVLITGASTGVGAAIAEKFLAEKAKTIIVSRGSEKLLETERVLKSSFSDESVYAERCDCSQKGSLEKLKERVIQSWGNLDIVVANVGDGRSKPDAIPDSEQWDKTWVNNFESALNTARVFLPMLKQSNGCLLFVSSIAAKEAFGAPVDYSTA